MNDTQLIPHPSIHPNQSSMWLAGLAIMIDLYSRHETQRKMYQEKKKPHLREAFGGCDIDLGHENISNELVQVSQRETLDHTRPSKPCQHKTSPTVQSHPPEAWTAKHDEIALLDMTTLPTSGTRKDLSFPGVGVRLQHILQSHAGKPPPQIAISKHPLPSDVWLYYLNK
jgi:hypothetical protein